MVDSIPRGNIDNDDWHDDKLKQYTHLIKKNFTHLKGFSFQLLDTFLYNRFPSSCVFRFVRKPVISAAFWGKLPKEAAKKTKWTCCLVEVNVSS